MGQTAVCDRNVPIAYALAAGILRSDVTNTTTLCTDNEF